ncbi:MAG: FAD-binding protein [Methanophagales archaeon ANME-1-THS]|nr:MAG: FAD-binding protein [Methanophagales archaeon ANME-1-THS]
MNSTNQQKSRGTYFAGIIGGGLGGLAAGAKLARAGQKILFFEQNTSIGGCARVVQGDNFGYEFSLHQLCGFEKGNLLREIFDEFGPSNGSLLIQRFPSIALQLGRSMSHYPMTPAKPPRSSGRSFPVKKEVSESSSVCWPY